MEDQKEEEGGCFLSEIKSSSLTELNNFLKINLGKKKRSRCPKKQRKFPLFRRNTRWKNYRSTNQNDAILKKIVTGTNNTRFIENNRLFSPLQLVSRFIAIEDLFPLSRKFLFESETYRAK